MRRLKAAFSFFLILAPLTAHAGMSYAAFSEIARMRLEVISFFLMAYLLIAFIYQRIWNSLGRDFPKIPRISYRGALGVLMVCGLFIYLVLTMISGARELMTPGAWARSGLMYKIREPDKDPQPWLDKARRESMERLRIVLWHYAEQHGGAFPSSSYEPGLPVNVWESIDPNGLPFVYMPGLKQAPRNAVLAYEPDSFGPTPFVLFTNGNITQLKTEELAKSVQKQIEEMDALLNKQSKP